MRRAAIGAVAMLCALSPVRGWAQQSTEAVPPATVPNLSAVPAAQPPAPDGASQGAQPQAGAAPAGWLLPHWDKGFVLASSPEGGMPFRLVLNHVSQFKYTNSMLTEPTYTDHFGTVHDVVRRNDVQLTRDVFYFSGYAFDPRLDFNILLFTSSATLVATAAGYAGFVFNKAFALRAGYFSLPSVRSLTGTYPLFHGIDRGMATNYFRPGFTQGIWANGEPIPGFNYIAMIGNALNTLDIKASSLDENRFAGAVSVWYDRNDFGKPWNDYEHHESVALRIGTAFTFAREDRLSDLEVTSPENNATYLSDGLLLFATGSLAPNVTVSLADVYLWAIDAGLKYRGLAINGELYLRWLNNFVSDGPLPMNHMFDWGFDFSAGHFLWRGGELFVRSSLIHGPFGTGVEGSVGFTWYPFKTRQVWLNAEVIGIRDCPYFSGYYSYAVGQTGVVFPAQFLVRF